MYTVYVRLRRTIRKYFMESDSTRWFTRLKMVRGRKRGDEIELIKFGVLAKSRAYIRRFYYARRRKDVESINEGFFF